MRSPLPHARATFAERKESSPCQGGARFPQQSEDKRGGGLPQYDPHTGRWTAKDPILFAGLQANLYVYVGNDPVNFVDPNGRWLVLAGGILGGAASAYSTWDAYTSGQIDGYQFAVAIAVGAGTGALATLPTGIVGGVFAGLVGSGVADAFNQATVTGGVDFERAGNAALFGGVGGFLGGVGLRLGGNVVRSGGVLGQPLSAGIKTLGNPAGACGNAIGTVAGALSEGP